MEATWSGPMVQTCVVHLIRAANRWVAYGDRKGVSAALKKVCTAFGETGAVVALAEFADSERGEKYPRSVKVWCDAWERFVPFCSSRRQSASSSTPRIRLSCLTMSCVKLLATASNFTNDESALKTLWLMICNIEDERLA
ncbi:IS256 family transposase [Corynebacterium diphtheriae]|nr:IS256 family transposase [Corynebacterium diphtheriae]